MANLKIIIDGPLMDGHRVTFKAPCACTGIDKLDIRYVDDDTQKSKLFTMKDTHGNNLTGLGNLFDEGAYVQAILSLSDNGAYLQNAATNGYLEEKFSGVQGQLDKVSKFLPDEAMGRIFTNVLDVDLGYSTFDSSNTWDGVIATEDASTLANSPVTAGAFYAYRKILKIPAKNRAPKTFLMLFETYPVGGRIWTAAYNPDTGQWIPKWNCHNDTDPGSWNVTGLHSGTTCSGVTVPIDSTKHDFLYIKALIANTQKTILVPLGLVSGLGWYPAWLGESSTTIDVSVTPTAVTFNRTSQYDQTTELLIYYLDRK